MQDGRGGCLSPACLTLVRFAAGRGQFDLKRCGPVGLGRLRVFSCGGRFGPAASSLDLLRRQGGGPARLGGAIQRRACGSPDFRAGRHKRSYIAGPTGMLAGKRFIALPRQARPGASHEVLFPFSARRPRCAGRRCRRRPIPLRRWTHQRTGRTCFAIACASASPPLRFFARRKSRPPSASSRFGLPSRRRGSCIACSVSLGDVPLPAAASARPDRAWRARWRSWGSALRSFAPAGG